MAALLVRKFSFTNELVGLFTQRKLCNVLGCLQEGRYEEALQKFLQVQHVGGYRPDLAYNIALCQYMLKQYGVAHTCVGEIIAKGIKEHPGILFDSIHS